MDDLPDMTDDERFEFVRQTVNRLHEVFPAVQVLTSWVDTDGETNFITLGRVIVSRDTEWPWNTWSLARWTTRQTSGQRKPNGSGTTNQDSINYL